MYLIIDYYKPPIFNDISSYILEPCQIVEVPKPMLMVMLGSPDLGDCSKHD